MEPNTNIVASDLTQYDMNRLMKELQGIQNGLDMLFTKNNSLDELDLTHGGGSTEDQAEYQRLNTAQLNIVHEVNRRHMLDEIK